VSQDLHVLWATDGSDGAHAAIPLLRQLILPAANRVTVLSVAPRPRLSGARPDPAYFALGSGTRESALAEGYKLASEEAALLNSVVKAEPEARWGHPIEEILRVARYGRVDLVVLGAKGHSNLGLLLLGSVAQGVVQHATLPVLVARPGERPVRRVVIGYDGSAPAKRGISFLDKIALEKGMRIDLVQVVQPFTMPEGTPIAYRRRAKLEAHAINEELRRKAEVSLGAMAARMRVDRATVEPRVLLGETAPSLMSWAESQECNLVIVGSRKPSAARSYLLGSTAERLVRHSAVSVLVVR
jgi:nucleotide-binding universal stress UspA family protein